MGLDFSTVVYGPVYDMYARPIFVTPLASQPTAASYKARGIYNRNRLNIMLEDGSTFIEQETILDIRAIEFRTLPQQNDLISIPADGNVPQAGEFQITSAWDNGGGEFSLHLRKIGDVARTPIVPPALAGPTTARLSITQARQTLSATANHT